MAIPSTTLKMVSSRLTTPLSLPKFAIVLAFLLTLCVSASAQTVTSSNGAEAAYLQYVAAWKAKDMATLSKLIADDYFTLNGQNKLASKATELAEAQADAPYTRMEMTEIHSKIVGDTGIVTGIIVVAGSNDGKPYTARARVLATLLKRNGQWQLVADQSAGTN